MQPGYVVVYFSAPAKARSRQEWQSSLDRVWPDVVAELRTNPGFKGAAALWNLDDSGQVSVIGQWENMEYRKAYEKRSSPQLRALMDTLFRDVPSRPRLLVTHAATG